MKKQYAPYGKSYFTLGIFFAAFGLLTLFGSFYTGTFFRGHEFLFLGLILTLFSLAYLVSRVNAEEMENYIKKQVRRYSLFSAAGFLLLFILINLFDVFRLDGFQTAGILGTLFLCSIPVSQIAGYVQFRNTTKNADG